MAESAPALRTIVLVATKSRMVRLVGFVALLAVATLSLRISLTNAFLYVNWADALSYAEGARNASSSMSPYSEMQLAGPYPIDHASFGLGFVYPPSGAYLLAPFMLGEPLWYLWNALSYAALLGVVALIVRQELGRLNVPVAVATGAATVVVFQVGLTDLKTGYLSPMVAAAFGAMWIWPRWSAIPALLFGLIKVFPAAGLLWTVRKGGAWRVPLLVAVGVLGAVTIAQPAFLEEWIVALSNAQPACPEFALPSFGCLGLPMVGYVTAVVLLVLAWKAARDDVSFLLLGLAMTVPLPDLYWGNLMVPMVAAVPLTFRLSREWLTGKPAPRQMAPALPSPDAS
jgi:hypothetical protein